MFGSLGCQVVKPQADPSVQAQLKSSCLAVNKVKIGQMRDHAAGVMDFERCEKGRGETDEMGGVKGRRKRH